MFFAFTTPQSCENRQIFCRPHPMFKIHNKPQIILKTSLFDTKTIYLQAKCNCKIKQIQPNRLFYIKKCERFGKTSTFFHEFHAKDF
jgi:hypothetical protein